ncbi:MAG TPA: 3-oxoacyl-ACP reductase family protein [Candidatus Eisenbacteria bacterium]|jgi:3-oxoacyl-[acyl-carrier protein] reductase|nr:3-oxoacyl-ACP reductase family protein [Candidatus Eisenbacteria bacterium]
MSALTSRVALVTGASRGIGKSIALALASAGADIAVNYNSNSAAAKSICEQIRAKGGNALPVQADVSKTQDVDRLVSTIERELGPPTILVNNAGIAELLPAEKVTEEIFERYLRVNLTSMFLVSQRVIPGMRAAHWGRIINLSSIAAQTGGIIGPHYAASKAGILGLTRSYALQLAKDGITANAIAPGLIETDMAAGVPTDVRKTIPAEMVGSPDEVAQVAVLLAENKMITGQTININGGRYIT